MADTFDLTIKDITPVDVDGVINYVYTVTIVHKLDGVAQASYPRVITMPASVSKPVDARVYAQAVVDDIKKGILFTRDPKKAGDTVPQLAVGSTFTLS